MDIEKKLMIWLIIITSLSCIDVYLTNINLNNGHEEQSFNFIIKYYHQNNTLQNYLVHRILIYLLFSFICLTYYYEEFAISIFKAVSLITIVWGIPQNVVGFLYDVL